MRPSFRHFACLASGLALAACAEEPRTVTAPGAPNFAAHAKSPSVFVVDLKGDTTAQNETPLAVNPADPDNLLTGANDWNYNDGCAYSASTDGGRKWTPIYPDGFIPGLTRYTNDRNVPGTGIYDAAGDPAVAFGPDGTAYFACQAFNFTPPFEIALYVTRSADGGLTWPDGVLEKPVQVSKWNGTGKSKGSEGQFPDHESIHVDKSPSTRFPGQIYVTWVQFNGFGTHSPVQVAFSSDGGQRFSVPIQVTKGPIRNNQDARIVTSPDGTAYLVFDNGIQGGKGTANYVSSSSDGGATWSAPFAFSSYSDPVCLFPPYCFNISGGAFRGPGSYPAPAFDPINSTLDVVYADIVNGRAKIFFTSAPSSDLTNWSTPVPVADAPEAGDRFGAEMSISSGGRIDVSFYDRSYSGNALVDVTYATSSDGGQTWSTTRVSKSGFNPAQYGVPSSSSSTGFRPFLGDYNGIVSLPDRAGLAWTGVGPTVRGSLPINLDIYFGSVTP